MSKKYKCGYLISAVIILLILTVIYFQVNRNRALEFNYEDVVKIELNTSDGKTSDISDKNIIINICSWLNATQKLNNPPACFGSGDPRITIYKETGNLDIYIAGDGCSNVRYNGTYFSIPEDINKKLRKLFIDHSLNIVQRRNGR
ncbi:hypothetical protein [Acetivibrio cellulolyticus]|uniref:hypothetical protein n=1 Tax=Acetivibrio cellulolyticus TaxID=35830 RepID=UPI0001E2D8BF|nr:hypothetical protein [Acetivibrio cellulolyticus]